jgi:hypothetical protein
MAVVAFADWRTDLLGVQPASTGRPHVAALIGRGQAAPVRDETERLLWQSPVQAVDPSDDPIQDVAFSTFTHPVTNQTKRRVDAGQAIADVVKHVLDP